MVEEYYTRICALADAPEGQDRPQEEIDALMARYLHRRDDECEGNAEERLYDQKKNNQLKEIDRCPTESDRALAKEQKNRDIQALFTQVLQADYESADYSEEKKQAGKVYDRYKTLQAKLSHHLGWDIFFAVFTLLCMIVPYAFLQRTGMLFTIPSFVLYGIAAGQFAGILFLCWFGFSLPLKRQLRRAQGDMAAVYRACKQKQEDSLRLLRERYGRQLLLIERRRYEIREIDRIYRENVRKNENIQKHRDMLEEVGDQLSGILNNLGEMGAISSSVELEPDEFDLEKPFDAPENKVYRVFSAEAIEQAELFRTGPVDRV